MVLFNRFTGAAALALGVLSAPAYAQDDGLRITIGLKAWHTTWETWNHPFEAETSDTKFAFIPNVAVGYGRFFASFGYFVKTTYDFPVSIGEAERKEMDFNVGYWLLQGDGGRLGLTLGYKTVDQTFGVNEFKITAPTIGVTASANISGPWSMYANAAYGPAKSKADSLGFDEKGRYASAEWGLAYSITRGTVLTAGFKGQIIETDCGVFGFTTDSKCRDNTDGFVFGVSHTF